MRAQICRKFPINQKVPGVLHPRRGTLGLYCGYKVLVAQVAQLKIMPWKPLNSFVRAAKHLLY